MNNEEILNELKKITKLITLVNSDKITSELEKLASTDERKMIWVLIDGVRTNEDITAISGAKSRTIRRFRKILEDADFIENPRGKPALKKLTYVPTEWIDLLPKEKETEEDNDE